MASERGWVLTSSSNHSENSMTFDAEFMRSLQIAQCHTHRISNFVPLTNASDISLGLQFKHQ